MNHQTLLLPSNQFANYPPLLNSQIRFRTRRRPQNSISRNPKSDLITPRGNCDAVAAAADAANDIKTVVAAADTNYDDDDENAMTSENDLNYSISELSGDSPSSSETISDCLRRREDAKAVLTAIDHFLFEQEDRPTTDKIDESQYLSSNSSFSTSSIQSVNLDDQFDWIHPNINQHQPEEKTIQESISPPQTTIASNCTLLSESEIISLELCAEIGQSPPSGGPDFLSNGNGFKIPVLCSSSFSSNHQDDLLKKLVKLDWEKTRTMFSLIVSRLENLINSTETTLCRLQHQPSDVDHRHRKQMAGDELRKFKRHALQNLEHIDSIVQNTAERRKSSEMDGIVSKIDVLFEQLKRLHDRSSEQIDLAKECVQQSENLLKSIGRSKTKRRGRLL